MRRSSGVGLYVAAALSGIAAAYALNEWVLHWWLARHPPVLPTNDDSNSPSSPSSPSTLPPAPPGDTPAPVTDTSADPNTPPARTLPPLRTHALPPPLPSGHALLSESYLAINPDAMTSSASLHTPSSHDGEDEGASQTNSSDTDTESFEDVLSPAPTTHVISRRRSQLRNHDLFAASHISFSDLGSMLAPQDEHA